MKALISAGAVLAIAGAASATDFTMPDSVLGAGESVSIDITLDVAADGFDIGFDYDETVADASWASDVQVIISDTNGAVLTIGGFTNVADADVLWAFDGSGSTNPGFYSDSFAFAFAAGDYTITFVNEPSSVLPAGWARTTPSTSLAAAATSPAASLSAMIQIGCASPGGK